MLKWMGALLVVTATGAAGLGAIQTSAQRIRILSGLIAALDLCQAELTFKLTALPDVMAQLARKSAVAVRPFFSAVEKACARLGEDSFGCLWQQCVQTMNATWQRPELDIMEELGYVLGRYDTDGQSRAIAYARSRLEALRDRAESDHRQQGRMYGALGLVSGLAVVILFI